MLLGGISLGGSVLGVTVPVGQGLATVAEVPKVPAVAVAPGVELPIAVAEVVPALVLLGDELVLGEELIVPVVVLEPAVVPAVPVVLHGATVVVVLLPGVIVPVWLGVVVVD